MIIDETNYSFPPQFIPMYREGVRGLIINNEKYYNSLLGRHG